MCSEGRFKHLSFFLQNFKIFYKKVLTFDIKYSILFM
nr:MAG TPA: hypothetical protein [Caudoviricetes sp.]